MAGVSISQSDWSLHRKGHRDRERHNEKIKEAIKKNLADIISREEIITADGDSVIKVPIRSLDEYKFRFDPRKQDSVGQGTGGSKVGDALGRDGNTPGQGGQAGSEPGVDYYEADVRLDELAALVFEDLGLPNLKDKKQENLDSESVRFTDIRKHGIMANLDKRRTIRENIKRNALKGKAKFKDIRSEDLRFKTWEEEIRPESNAVVLAMMDVSGSMGEFEKYVARSFYFWMVRFLRTRYQNVAIVFISHHTEAKEVTEQEFFSKGESGGTKVSSAYELALEIIMSRYPVADWNIYPFHFSDGDNMHNDNNRCVVLVQQLITMCNLFGYGEIKQNWIRSSTLHSVYGREIDDPKFVSVLITEKEGVFPALKDFFSVRHRDAVAR